MFDDENFDRYEPMIASRPQVDPYLPIVVSGVTDAASVSAGFSHSCAVLPDGSVHCWGNNGNGQVGYGTASRRPRGE